jgi:hypothetical protein
LVPKAGFLRKCFGLLAVLSVTVCAWTGASGATQAFGADLPPWFMCFASENADAVGTKYISLKPASGATVQVGTPVTFSAGSSWTPTFDIASSEALLPSPDIDSGTGSQAGAVFEFTSTKASAIPRTIYWRASFTFTPEDCEQPYTFTTPVRTLTITQSEAELTAAMRQQEEEATRKKNEEEAAAKKREEETAAAGTVALDSVVISVRARREAAISLTCSDIARCTGELTLTARQPVGNKARPTKTELIGTASFSIPAGTTEIIDVVLDKSAIGLMSAAQGHLNASLTIQRASPLPAKTQIQRVRLEKASREGKGRQPVRH